VDKRKYKLFTGLNPNTKRNAPAATVDDFKSGDEGPEQKPGKPCTGNDQASDPPTVHYSQVVARGAILFDD
jgi:hypothetical protein